ncbi:PaaI family thioesterase [Poriferisphaera sp. WC338]|uniref:PaaI family thioesterase n=1 Tax=Poriferisphaera sp. WC338 TaxID=3425129 RepID=UPI003D8130F5
MKPAEPTMRTSTSSELSDKTDLPVEEEFDVSHTSEDGSGESVSITDEDIAAYAAQQAEVEDDPEVSDDVVEEEAEAAPIEDAKAEEKPKHRETLIKIPGQGTEYKPSWIARLINRGEAKISKLSTKNNFWHRVCSWVFLPLAFRSGIKFHHGDVGTFSALLPFRRFNRNWYNAMAGGALLANSEVAGGMYVFQQCGQHYTVVCKHLSYDFHRPCFGPAVYRIEPEEDIKALVASGKEFNITIKMQIVQMVVPGDRKERRVGKCTARFHVTPKTQYRQRKKFVRKRATGK